MPSRSWTFLLGPIFVLVACVGEGGGSDALPETIVLPGAETHEPDGTRTEDAPGESTPFQDPLEGDPNEPVDPLPSEDSGVADETSTDPAPGDPGSPEDLPTVDPPPTDSGSDAPLGDPGTADSGAPDGTGDPALPPPCEETWTDPTTGLTWQNCPGLHQGDWASAIRYCDRLVHAGLDDWRLPSLSELRSLIRGCPDTVLGGPCRASDDCLGETPTDGCMNRPCSVPSCDYLGGPADGCYRDSALVGPCDYHWSASESATYSDSAWYVDFATAIVNPTGKFWEELYARCVRGTWQRPAP